MLITYKQRNFLLELLIIVNHISSNDFYTKNKQSNHVQCFFVKAEK